MSYVSFRFSMARGYLGGLRAIAREDGGNKLILLSKTRETGFRCPAKAECGCSPVD
ncbi:hypothetical protein [Mesorhizobium sp. 128a]